MIPEQKDSFQNGRITLDVYQLNEPLRNIYWLRAGVAAMELTEQDLGDLIELLDAYYGDTTLKLSPLQRIISWFREIRRDHE